MAAHEGAGTRQREAAGFKMRVPHGPRMNHVRPDFQRDRHGGRARGADEADRVVDQRLVGTDLNQRRGKSAQAGIERRDTR